MALLQALVSSLLVSSSLLHGLGRTHNHQLDSQSTISSPSIFDRPYVPLMHVFFSALTSLSLCARQEVSASYDRFFHCPDLTLPVHSTVGGCPSLCLFYCPDWTLSVCSKVGPHIVCFLQCPDLTLSVHLTGGESLLHSLFLWLHFSSTMYLVNKSVMFDMVDKSDTSVAPLDMLLYYCLYVVW